MANSSEELEKVRAVLIGVTEAIGSEFKATKDRFDKLIDTIYEKNQEMVKENQLASLQGEMHAVPSKRLDKALEKADKEAIAKNEKIKIAQVILRELQEKSPLSPDDAKNAKTLERRVNELNNQNAELLATQKLVLKTTFVTGQADADIDKSREALIAIQDRIGTGLKHNNILKSEFQADRLATLGITAKTGTTTQDRQLEQPPVQSNSPKLK